MLTIIAEIYFCFEVVDYDTDDEMQHESTMTLYERYEALRSVILEALDQRIEEVKTGKVECECSGYRICFLRFEHPPEVSLQRRPVV